jgi:endonuclease III
MAAKKKPSEIQSLMQLLTDAYGHAECALVHQNVYELLAATILSAQCTDKRVNMVTPALFKRYPTPADLAVARLDDVEELVRTTGFYRNKAKSLVGMAHRVAQEHGGEIPRDLETLITLPGVARKTANVVLGVGYGISVGIVVDTHVSRLSARLGLTQEESPVKIERDLMGIIPKNRWIDFSHMLIEHGRQICSARAPRCDKCMLTRLCPSAFAFPQFTRVKPAVKKIAAKKVAKKAATKKVAKKQPVVKKKTRMA